MDYSVDIEKQKEFLNFRLWESLKKVFLPPKPTPILIGEQLLTDVHAHWLPGVDDGAKTMEEGLEIVRALMDLGFKKLIATPHIKKNFFENDPKQLTAVFQQFKKEVQTKGWDVELSLAAEYMLDENFKNHLENGLLTLTKDLALIEMSLFQVFQGIEHTLFEIQLKGYRPVLAHPERYTYYHKKWQQLKRLKDMGCLFQLNISALAGRYGKEVAEAAHFILNKGWYDLAGTDVHHIRQLKEMTNVQCTGSFFNHTFQ